MRTTPASVREQRERELNRETAERLRDVAELIASMAQALEEDDHILGALAGQGIANHLPLLPQHVRETFVEYLTEEAARGARADLLYFEEQAHALD